MATLSAESNRRAADFRDRLLHDFVRMDPSINIRSTRVLCQRGADCRALKTAAQINAAPGSCCMILFAYSLVPASAISQPDITDFLLYNTQALPQSQLRLAFVPDGEDDDLVPYSHLHVIEIPPSLHRCVDLAGLIEFHRWLNVSKGMSYGLHCSLFLVCDRPGSPRTGHLSVNIAPRGPGRGESYFVAEIKAPGPAVAKVEGWADQVLNIFARKNNTPGGPLRPLPGCAGDCGYDCLVHMEERARRFGVTEADLTPIS